MSEGFRCPYTPPTPRYYEDLRQLWVGQFLALEFEREAWNQLAVLTAFQLPGWPPVVKSPLRGKIDKKSVAKLKKTLFLLHDRQKTLFVWFHGRKWEQEISWSYTIPLKGT